MHHRAFISHTPGGSSRYKPPAPSCHGKRAPTSSINRILIQIIATLQKKKQKPQQPWSHLTVQSGVGRTAIGRGKSIVCVDGSFMRAKPSSGQPSHHTNYICCVSSVSRVLINPPGAADRDGLSLERCQYASKQKSLMSWPLLLTSSLRTHKYTH